MRKSFIIMRSEFMRRVTQKSFIITTLLGPLLLVGFFAVIITVSTFAVDRDSRTAAIVDETGVLLERILAQNQGDHTLVGADSASAASDVLRGRIDGYVYLPEGMIRNPDHQPQFFSAGGGFALEGYLRVRIERALEDFLLDEQGVSDDVRAIMDRSVRVNSVQLTDEGEEAGSSRSYGVLGGLMGMLMYMSMLIYSTVVMHGTLEEKGSRVVEVMVSSVRPFELLLGKVLGIGAMGMVQMALWALLIMASLLFAGPVLSLFMDPAAYGLPETASTSELMEASGIALPVISPIVFVWFVLFFLFGYLLYSGMFATVGTLVENPQDSQGLVLPVMMPLIISIVFLSPVLTNPDSTFAVVLSMIPLTSPVPMVVRLAVTDVPLYEVLASFSLLVLGFLGSIWLSARVFRTSILMYGKKATFRDLVRYFRYS